MKIDIIEIGGKDYRIEFNWNTICNFLERENKTLSDLDKLQDAKPREITSFIYSSILEGCRMDGVDVPFTQDELGAVLSPVDVGEIMRIYKNHAEVKTSAVKVKKK